MNDINYAVIIENLTKSYGDVKAVNDISFRVERGSLFAFLGINGAGKSTTINIICSILKKDGGKVYVNGYDLDTQSSFIRNEIGIVFQTSVLDMGLTVKQNLDIRASFYSMSREEEDCRFYRRIVGIRAYSQQTCKEFERRTNATRGHCKSDGAPPEIAHTRRADDRT